MGPVLVVRRWYSGLHPLIWGAFALTFIAVLIAAIWAFAPIGIAGRDEWRTYRNEVYGYEFRYPSAWKVQIRNPEPGDDFETQYVNVSGPGGSVLVAVNFQGDWCLAGGRTESRQIMVSGVAAAEYLCYLDGSAAPYNIVRYLEGARGRRNYTVWGQVESDLTVVAAIVEGFRLRD